MKWLFCIENKKYTDNIVFLQQIKTEEYTIYQHKIC